jgi:two-component system OmpR family sensor kinase
MMSDHNQSGDSPAGTQTATPAKATSFHSFCARVKQGAARTYRKMKWSFDSIPLSTKLVSLLLVLLACGLTIAGIATRSLIWMYMVDRTDEQLITQAQSVVTDVNSYDIASLGGPSDYFLQIRDSQNRVLHTPLVPRIGNDNMSIPVLPPSGSDAKVRIGVPFTVAGKKLTTGRSVGSHSASPWRMVALRWVNEENGNSGIVYIGLSLSSALGTASAIMKYFVLVGMITLAVAMVFGTIFISRAFAPLKRIEKTAAQIAAGDLTRRIPPAPKNTEVGSLSDSLNTMLAQIEQSFHKEEQTNLKMKQFVSDASHELRTPLAAIRGYAELYFMQRQEPHALQRADETIQHIEKSSEQMTLLVQNLLSLARLDEGRGVDLNQKVRFDQIVKDGGEDLHALDPHRPISFGHLVVLHSLNHAPQETFVRSDLPVVPLKADGQKLRQVITNIVGNIHRYTPSTSPVEISLTLFQSTLKPSHVKHLKSEPASVNQFFASTVTSPVMHSEKQDPVYPYAVLRVSDHGPGVPEESLSRLFERFYTADPSRAKERGGTGLGMAIAQSVIAAHGGFIAATTTDGGGLTLTVVVPVARSAQG